jgi:hypothetical protein
MSPLAVIVFIYPYVNHFAVAFCPPEALTLASALILPICLLVPGTRCTTTNRTLSQVEHEAVVLAVLSALFAACVTFNEIVLVPSEIVGATVWLIFSVFYVNSGASNFNVHYHFRRRLAAAFRDQLYFLPIVAAIGSAVHITCMLKAATARHIELSDIEVFQLVCRVFVTAFVHTVRSRILADDDLGISAVGMMCLFRQTVYTALVLLTTTPKPMQLLQLAVHNGCIGPIPFRVQKHAVKISGSWLRMQQSPAKRKRNNCSQVSHRWELTLESFTLFIKITTTLYLKFFIRPWQPWGRRFIVVATRFFSDPSGGVRMLEQACA